MKKINANAEYLKKEQDRLDVEKWFASEKAGMDLCGRCQFCDYCDKYEEYPCAKSYLRYEEEEAENEEAEEVVVEVTDDYKTVVRYKRGFLSRLIQNEDLQKQYTELKNELLSFDGIYARMAFKHESFRLGNTTLAKIKVRGKRLNVYLALNPADFVGSKYIFEDDTQVKSYAHVPMKLKISSERALKWAKELIAKLAKNNKLTQGEIPTENYSYPYENDEALIEKVLIKPYTVKIKLK